MKAWVDEEIVQSWKYKLRVMHDPNGKQSMHGLILRWLLQETINRRATHLEEGGR